MKASKSRTIFTNFIALCSQQELVRGPYNGCITGMQKGPMSKRKNPALHNKIGRMEGIRFSASCNANLAAFYKRADFEGKQQIIGSIFPDKLVFKEKNYRTTQVNDVTKL